MYLRLLFIFIFSGFYVAGQAQSQRITGKVINQQNDPLAGVSIKIIGSNGGTATDMEGHYALTLPAGQQYEIEFSAVGYKPKLVADVQVTEGLNNELNVVLEVLEKNLQAVVVKSTRTNARLESINSAIAFQRNTNTVAAVVSAETIRRSPDKNTSEVLKRIPGTSIQEGKYLIVRGLSDRYNFAMLNGIPLSSTEPDRKTFSFDIFPSSLIDNIIVNKAFVPELPGEWAGGLVQVNTKDIPSSNFLTIQAGTGFNTQTVSDDFFAYKGGKYDWLGIDDGTRAIPGELPTKSQLSAMDQTAKTEFGKKFHNTWSADKQNSFLSLLNKKFELSGGFNKTLRGGIKMGATLGVTYNQSVKRTTFKNRLYSIQNDIASLNFDYDNEKYSKDVLWGALANVTFKLGANHKVSFKNLLNINATNYVTERRGKDFEADPINGENIKASELALKTNTFFNTQVSGDHNLPNTKTKLHWYGSFNILDQYIPDQRRLQYNQDHTLPGEPYLLLVGASKTSQKSGSRYFGFLNDYIYTAGGDVTQSYKLFGFNQSVKGGYLFQVKDRLFDSRPFAIYLSADNTTLRKLPADQIFAAPNFGDGFDNKFGFNELTGDQYRYMANTILNAGFIQFDNQFTKNLRATWGLRVEDYDQVIGSIKQSDRRHLHTRVRDFLPGINITYKIGNTSNLRLSGSQTVIRPEFRELSDFAFYDFDLGATVTGNKVLQRTKVTNADLRYEFYPRAGEIFTLGAFYKYFNNPIELYFNQTGAGSSSTFNYINADKANGFGVEVEYRKKLDFAEALRNFTFQSNLSYIYNRVEQNSSKLNRPMQGQSPYVINASLQYDIEKFGLNTTLLYNQIGDRILFVGGNDYPPVWEATRPVFDLQIAKKIIKGKGELKLNASDIFNQVANYYHDLNDNRKYDKTTDALAIKRKYGATYNISFSYSIK